MWFWRRRRSYNQELLEDAGPELGSEAEIPNEGPVSDEEDENSWVETYRRISQISRVASSREREAFGRAFAPNLKMAEVEVVVSADGRPLGSEAPSRYELQPLIDAVEPRFPPPFRVFGRQETDGHWHVRLKAIRLLRLPGAPDAANLSLEVSKGKRTFLADGATAFGDVSKLELLAGAHHDDFVLLATRVEGDLWEVELSPQ